jgi:hypothetical protein
MADLSKASRALALETPRRSFMRTIEALSHSRRKWEVFRDFCELSALSLVNALDVPATATWTAREERHAKLRGTYSDEEFQQLAFALACVVEALEAESQDFLGSVFMELDLGSHWHGQFFTPYNLAAAMGRMTYDHELLKDREFITVQEPTCGAGVMVIGFADAMRAAGANPQQQMHVTAIDIDPLCVHMCLIQLSLLHIPAVVVHGNALSLEEWSRWYTPAHLLGNWHAKLRRAEETGPAAVDAAAEVRLPHGNQLTLDLERVA